MRVYSKSPHLAPGTSVARAPIKACRHAGYATHPRTVGQKHRVVVVGSGWAGFTFLKTLDTKLYDITVISPRSYFVFTPLLAGTAVGTLEFRCALESVRNTRRCTFHEAWVERIDFESGSVTCTSALHSRRANNSAADFQIQYDSLVLTPGCYSNTYGIPGVQQYAHFLKDVKDARAIRSRILKCFEEAALPTTSEDEKRRLLSYCIVGGGPTGIEFAAELYDLINDNLRKLYPALHKYVSIDIYDVAEKILGGFDEKLGEYARQRFARGGINVHLEQAPIKVEADRLIFKNHPPKPYGMLVWSTGLMASPLIESLDLKKHGRTGGLVTNDRLQVLDKGDGVMEDVYALGDCAVTESGDMLPATAQVAAQKAKYLATSLNGTAMGSQPGDFVYKNRGIMAFLGGGSAIVQGNGNTQISGRTAYFAWKLVYLTMTVSIRNRILIPIYWALNGILGRDINRF